MTITLALTALSTAALGAQPADTIDDWKTREAPYLTDHSQVTSRGQFMKAGESYFSADGKWVVFQAIEVPKQGADADPFYAMFIARCTLDESSTLGLAMRISPENSANTCGWFHPTQPQRVLFGSTVTRPQDDQKSGFQVGSRRYVWQFPSEMEVCETTVQAVAIERGEHQATQVDPIVKPVFSLPNYDAECSFSPDGRYILYAHVEDRPKDLPADVPHKPDANLYIFDTVKQTHTLIVEAKGYDGGPFYSPDGKSICYRSDRRGDDLLQIFMADIKFNDAGEPVGLDREYQLTDNAHVNWCPFFHPSGEYLVYATSEVGHDNYEVFALELNRAKLAASASKVARGDTVKVTGLKSARVTSAKGADVLPAFSADGKFMIWTSQRGPKVEGEAKSSSQLWIARVNGSPFKE